MSFFGKLFRGVTKIFGKASRIVKPLAIGSIALKLLRKRKKKPRPVYPRQLPQTRPQYYYRPSLITSPPSTVIQNYYKKYFDKYNAQIRKQQQQLTNLMNQLTSINKTILQGLQNRKNQSSANYSPYMGIQYGNLMSENFFSSNTPAYTSWMDTSNLSSDYLKNYYVSTPFGITWF